MVFFLALLAGSMGFAESIVINNQSSYPAKSSKSKMAIQWATSGKEVEENNNLVKNGLKLNLNTLQTFTQIGEISLEIPKKAEYFRIIVWSQDKIAPDFLTSWVDVVPNKIYTLTKKHLVPIALMSGTGC